jgi:cation transport protein ChaC
MSPNTIAMNQRMNQFDGHPSVWLFGYGSLIHGADFPFMARRPARISGWTRRFWQGSHDHRGTEAAPGRVATLVAETGAMCDGMAYLIEPKVFARLDFRERNGYLRLAADILFDDDSSALGLLYIATEDNAAFLGPASELEIACQIAQAEGTGGPNRDYLTALAQALRTMGKVDAHVFEIERHLGDM